MTHLIYIFLGLGIEVYFILLIIGVTTFFFWKWLFNRYIQEQYTRRIATWIATLIVTPIIYSGLISVFIFSLSYEPSVNFNKSQWQKNIDGRYKMANDLIESKTLIGKDTNEVKQTLGIPTWHGEPNKQWTYDMGMGGGGLGFMFNHLIINYDKNNKVVLVEHAKIRD